MQRSTKRGQHDVRFLPPLGPPERTSTAEREPVGVGGGGEACACAGVVGAGLNV